MSTVLKLTPAVQPWIGTSDALFKLNQQINQLAHCNLPVHIIGEPGSGKHLAVCHLHNLGKASSESLIVSNVANWGEQCAAAQLEQLIAQTQNGSLYLKNIDMLSSAQAESVKDYWLNLSTEYPALRLITSTTREKQAEALGQSQQHSFLSWLHYHCLELCVPSLHERKEDIDALVKHYRATCQHIANLQLHPQALEILKAYNWPHNVKQLKRCLDKLSFLSNQQAVSSQALLSIFPAMHTEATPKPMAMHVLKPVEPSLTEEVQSLIQCNDEHDLLVAEQRGEAVAATTTASHTPHKSHPALIRALQFVDKNFEKPLSLSEVASYACVSPSHLSFLFKRFVGQSFKQTLLRIRIKRAMVLLREDPYSQVTEVCDDVGFSDLSFFVRKFKSVVGVSPGVYRDQPQGE